MLQDNKSKENNYYTRKLNILIHRKALICKKKN